MRTRKRKLTVFILVFAILFSTYSLSSFSESNSTAEKNVEATLTKISSEAGYKSGSFYTLTGKQCVIKKVDGIDTHFGPDGKAKSNCKSFKGATQCLGFAKDITAQLYNKDGGKTNEGIFARNYKDVKNGYEILGNAKISKDDKDKAAILELLSKARIGDVLDWGTHTAIYLGHDSSTGDLKLYHANLGEGLGLPCEIKYNQKLSYKALYTYESGKTMYLFHYKNYDKLYGGTNATTPEPQTIIKDHPLHKKQSVQGDYTLTIKSDGSLWGKGQYVPFHIKPQKKNQEFKMMDDVISVYSCENMVIYTMVLKKDGSLWGWESDDTLKKLATSISAIYSFDLANFAIKNDGTLLTWGYNVPSIKGFKEGHIPQKFMDNVKSIEAKVKTTKYSQYIITTVTKKDGSTQILPRL